MIQDASIEVIQSKFEDGSPVSCSEIEGEIKVPAIF